MITYNGATGIELTGKLTNPYVFTNCADIYIHDFDMENLSVEALVFNGCHNIKIKTGTIGTCGAASSAALWGTGCSDVIVEDVTIDLSLLPLSNCSFVIMGSSARVRVLNLTTIGNPSFDGNGASVDVGDSVNYLIAYCTGTDVNQGAHLEKGTDLGCVFNNTWRGCGAKAQSGGGVVLNLVTSARQSIRGNNLSAFYQGRGIYNYQSATPDAGWNTVDGVYSG